MIRIMMFMLLLLILAFQLVDNVYLRKMTAKKAAQAVSVKEGRIYPLVLETQEIVNSDSVSKYAKEAVVKIFNYRPGQSLSHIQSPDIKRMFINEDQYEKFKNLFVRWSLYEFSVNNISIKESIVKTDSIVMTPPASVDGARIWGYRATVPVVDRGVGGTVLDVMYLKIGLVYLGPEGGMGIYSVKISL